ncbi:DUF5658 family protein [Halomicroarcula sp. GCM10025324]|uniref:DUF5658 family protein n=1 Tax=Haloarcula TaxID=2237 RepID=UPI0023E86E2D|nr:DUF5658 family protein [Halomicroarcula sp. ZS-22-S1]
MSDERGSANVDWFYAPLSVRWVGSVDRVLWALVLGGATADTILTLVGLQLCFVEANPVAAWALERLGGLGLILLKTGALVVLYAVVNRLPRRYSLAALLGFSLPQMAASVMNTVLIVTHASSCFA